MKRYYAKVNGREYEVEIEELAAGAAGLIASPMPGQVLRVLAKPGQAVKRGQVLLVLEAMKMENEIMAPADGTVSQVYAAEGAAVNTGDPLIAL